MHEPQAPEPPAYDPPPGTPPPHYEPTAQPDEQPATYDPYATAPYEEPGEEPAEETQAYEQTPAQSYEETQSYEQAQAYQPDERTAEPPVVSGWYRPDADPQESAAWLPRRPGRPTAVGRLVSLIVSVGLAWAIALALAAFVLRVALGRG